MRTATTRILTGVFILICLLIAFALILNARDEPLRAEVRKIWDQTDEVPGEAARRSYLYLLGLAAGERVDPETRGRQLWPQLGESSVRDALDSTGWTKSTFDGCPDLTCGTDDLTPAAQKILRDTQVTGLLYAGWMDFADHAFLSPTLAIPGPRAHQLYTLRLAQWLDQGGGERVWDSLANANQFYARILTNGSLANRLIAMTNLTINARFVAKAVARAPDLRVPDQVIDTWRLPDPADLSGGILISEVRRLKDALKHLSAGPTRLALRPNETANRAFELLNQSLFTDCPVADGACVPALDYADWSRPDHWLINPVGRAVVIELARGLAHRPDLRRLRDELIELKARLRRRP